MATVHTYYEPCYGIARPTKLLNLWRESWEIKGWKTRILSESDAKDHPGYKSFSERISRYPTVNNPGYERACYMRHMAMVMQQDGRESGGLLVDYDCLLRSDGGMEALSSYLCPMFPVILEPTKVPCAVLGDENAFGDICDMLFNYDPKGEKHVSDMTILRQQDIFTEHTCLEHLNSASPIPNSPGNEWKSAPIIHFSTYSFHKLGWKGDKADLIQRVLATL